MNRLRLSRESVDALITGCEDGTYQVDRVYIAGFSLQHLTEQDKAKATRSLCNTARQQAYWLELPVWRLLGRVAFECAKTSVQHALNSFSRWCNERTEWIRYQLDGGREF